MTTRISAIELAYGKKHRGSTIEQTDRAFPTKESVPIKPGYGSDDEVFSNTMSDKLKVLYAKEAERLRALELADEIELD